MDTDNYHHHFFFRWIFGGLACTVLAGYLTACKPETANVEQTDEFSEQVTDLLAKMTTAEKIAELTQDAPANERLGIPLMRYSECLHGLWIEGATVYPQAIALGGTWEPDLVRQMTDIIAREARAVNISHCYSPNLDVVSGDARYGRVEESYGEDPYLVSRMGVAFIEGLQGTGEEFLDENHLLATAKHFVGYPENRRGINGGFVDISERRLKEIFLPPFEAAVKEARVGSIMPGHQDMNGIPLHMDGDLLNGLLREEWGFKGFIVSDNNDISRLELMHHIARNRTEAAVMGLKAGVDMDLVIGKSPEFSAYIDHVLADTLAEDPSLMKYVDQSVRRILTAKYQLGLFDDDKVYADTLVSTPEAQEMALHLARKAVTLLKNEGNLLPLDPEKLKSVAVIGPNAGEVRLANGRYTQMGGYSGIPPYYTSVLEGIEAKVGKKLKVNYAQGCDLKSNSKAGFPEAIAAARRSDVVILAIGGSTVTCGEGKDRDDLDLFGVQNELVEAIQQTGKPVVAVLLNGRPLTVNYLAENIPAIIEGWYLGMRTGEALADVIFGDYNPGGKLTVSFPRSVGQLPVTYLEKPDFVGSGKGQYRFSDKSPLFPFGFGLSYTTFEYGAPTLSAPTILTGESSSVSVTITNTGDRAGEEVVQMYVRDDHASVGRYLKMLKGFKRVSLAQGETKTVTFPLGFEELALYDKDMERVVEPGTFTIYVGASSQADDLQATQLTVARK
ncbi:glycoside hydrolase family 3 N-terminal domain-containing protein [Neolewinella agarilytica]|uniref:Beta-glucosidase n=1 Tax=Neolewinella agarilytica TaxID=478744 RepID=A0A1H9D8G4_9BACT|nr:glycoside hydrolase family 3 N-terminal domain-containing protein [Neolewinella agarilytica]SEQ09068.1 beta-glucosidase [Neolewinella agarilytica]